MVSKEQVLEAVCDVMGLHPIDVLEGSQHAEITRARYMTAYLLRTEHGMTFRAIGEFLHRTVTPVRYGIERAEALLDYRPSFREDHQKVLAKLADMQKVAA